MADGQLLPVGGNETPYLTLQKKWDTEGQRWIEENVGSLQLEGLDNLHRCYKPDYGTPSIFLCHRGIDTKEIIIRPTFWYLKKIVKVSAFFDQDSMRSSGDMDYDLAQGAYKCTHGLALISPNFRESKCAVQELNTFMERKSKGNITLHVALWGEEIDTDLEGYAAKVGKINLLKQGNTKRPSEYLLKVLWPTLEKDFLKHPLSKEERVRHLLEYICYAQGDEMNHIIPGGIPEDLKQFEDEQQNCHVTNRSDEHGGWVKNNSLCIIGIVLSLVVVGVFVGVVVLPNIGKNGQSEVPPTNSPVFEPPSRGPSSIMPSSNELVSPSVATTGASSLAPTRFPSASNFPFAPSVGLSWVPTSVPSAHPTFVTTTSPSLNPSSLTTSQIPRDYVVTYSWRLSSNGGNPDVSELPPVGLNEGQSSSIDSNVGRFEITLASVDEGSDLALVDAIFMFSVAGTCGSTVSCTWTFSDVSVAIGEALPEWIPGKLCEVRQCLGLISSTFVLDFQVVSITRS